MNNSVEFVKAITPIIIATMGSITSISIIALAVLAPRINDTRFNSLAYIATGIGTGGIAGAAGAAQMQKSQNIDRIDNVEQIK